MAFLYLIVCIYLLLIARFVVVESLTCVWLFATPWTAAVRHACLSPSPRVCSNSCPLSHWCHPSISTSDVPFSCPQSFPTSGSFPVSWLLASGGQSVGVSASASVLPMSAQGWFPLGLVWSLCSSRDSQESSPAPQFESISSSVLSLLYGPILISIHDYRKNHSFDYKLSPCQIFISKMNGEVVYQRG